MRWLRRDMGARSWPSSRWVRSRASPRPRESADNRTSILLGAPDHRIDRFPLVFGLAIEYPQRMGILERTIRSGWYNSRMSSNPRMSMARRSKPIPHAQTGQSVPRGWVTSGLKIPAPPSSNHFPLQRISTSMLGSVYGKYAGLTLTSEYPIFE